MPQRAQYNAPEVSEMRAVGVAEARANLSALVKEASTTDETFVIHSKGVPRAVLIGIDEYREIEATLEEMGDPEARRLLEEGRDDIKKGRARSAEEIFGEALIKG
jgi:prevent-host-death family protein